MPFDPKLGPGNEYFVDEARGLVYQVGSDGQRHYVSPAAMTPAQLRESQQGLPHDPANFYDRSQIPKGGFLRGRGEWDAEKGEWDQPINWGNLMGAGIGGAIAAPFAASALGSMFGGGGSAAAGTGTGVGASTLPATALPGAASAMTSAGSIGAGMGGGTAGLGAAAGGGSALGSIAREATKGLGGRAVEAAIAGLAGLPGLMGGGPTDQEQALTRRLEEMLAQQQRRTSSQDALFEAVTRMGANLMPNSAWGSGGNPYGR